MDSKRAPHALTALLRQKIAREARAPTAASGDKLHPAAPHGTHCWLCSQVPQAVGQTVRLMSPSCPSEAACPVLCAPCFLTTYLAARVLFPLVQDGVVAPLAAAMDTRANALLRAGRSGLPMAIDEAKPPAQVGFVNSYSLRSFVRLEDPASPLSPQGTTLAPSAVHRGRQPTKANVPAAVPSLLEWSCPMCTLQNDAANPLTCLACGARNPDTLSCPGCGIDIHPLLLMEGAQPATCAPVPRAAPRRHDAAKPSARYAPPLLFDIDSTASFQFITNAVGKGLFDPVARGTVLQPMQHQLWICDVCTLMNARATRRCDMCRALRRVVCGRCTFANALKDDSHDTGGGTASAVMEPTIVCEMCTASICVPLVDARLLQRLSQHASQSSWAPEAMLEMQRCDAIEQGSRRLVARVERDLKGFVKQQLGDGNCLFRGIADELFGMPQLHAVVRHLITSYMGNNTDAYEHYFENRQQWESYLAQLAQDGTWGDELCIHAATNVFHADITVVSSTEAYWYQRFEAPSTTTSTTDPSTDTTPPRIFLAYTSPVHFDSIRLSKVHCTSSPASALMHKMLQELEVALTEERQWTDAGEVIAALSGTSDSVDREESAAGSHPQPAASQHGASSAPSMDEWDVVAHQS